MARPVAWMVVLALGAAGSGAASPAVRVSGPRATGLARPMYEFSFPGASGFRCAFDSRRLHLCARRYSERLRPGIHYLRVRARLSGGTLSRTTLVRVIVASLVADRP